MYIRTYADANVRTYVRTSVPTMDLSVVVKALKESCVMSVLCMKILQHFQIRAYVHTFVCMYLQSTVVITNGVNAIKYSKCLHTTRLHTGFGGGGANLGS